MITLLFAVALAAPPLTADRPITIEVREVSLEKLFELVSSVSRTGIVLDKCVKDRDLHVDLKLKNTRASAILDILASKFDLAYRPVKEGVYVDCKDKAEDPRLDDRIDIEVNELPLKDALAVVQQRARLLGAVCSGTCDTPVTMKLRNVRVRTVLLVLADVTGTDIALREGQLVTAPHP